MKKIPVYITLVLVLFFGAAKAQILEPTKWTVEYNNIGATEGELIFKVVIESGWHVFSQKNPPGKDGLGGGQPLDITIIPNANFEVIGKVEEPVYKKVYSDIWESDEYYFTDSAVFKQRIKLKTKEPFTITGKVAGQVCSDSICLQTGDNYTVNVRAKGQ